MKASAPDVSTTPPVPVCFAPPVSLLPTRSKPCMRTRLATRGPTRAPPPAPRPRPHPRHTAPPRMSATDTRAQALAKTAAVAAAAVNAAVGERPIEAPDDVAKSFVARGGGTPQDDAATGAAQRRPHTPLDAETGLPLVYDRAAIERYWAKERSALQARWRDFLSVAAPFLARVAAILVRSGADGLQRDAKDLARQAREGVEQLGPTFIKAAQMLSVRPDVLPQAALSELAVLQDAVKPFDSDIAREMIEKELGCPIGEVFAQVSDEPVAAASLAQVYKATLVSGEVVAVKVQRPGMLQTVSKDLYVLRRAAEVYQGLMDRFAPQQQVDYVALLNEWAIGFYTELDFANEASNQRRIRTSLLERDVPGVYVPAVFDSLCTRRLLVTEWVDGRKLSECTNAEIRELTAIGQECFLVQLLQLGFVHADPHPGNLLLLDDARKGRLALLDFGLVATLQQDDIDQIVSSVIHLANRDYAALVDDFVALRILPPDCDRRLVVPLMDKALSPYIKGGGAKKYEQALRASYGMDKSAGAAAAVGGFQAMTRDALTVFNDVPFSIPAYFALVGRAVVTLEGLALSGDPDYALIMEAYPFVARRLLADGRAPVQAALQDVLYASSFTTDGSDTQKRISPARLAALLSGALGAVARAGDGAFVDLDAVPDEGVPLGDALRLALGASATGLRSVLREELDRAVDVLLRRGIRRAFAAATAATPAPPRLPLVGAVFPAAERVRGPVLLPGRNGSGVRGAFAALTDVVDAVAPRLEPQEEVYATSLVELVEATAGADIAAVVGGEAFARPGAFGRVAAAVIGSGRAPGWEDLPAGVRQAVESGLGRVEGALGDDMDGWGEVVAAVDGLGEEERAVGEEELRSAADRAWVRAVERINAKIN